MVIVSTFHLNLPATEVLTPREAVVSVKNGLLRSGPDEKYYPTRVLEKGEPLEVYRVIDNQWYGVRPPRGSFSWVDAHFVQLLGKGDVGMIIQDNVHVRVGPLQPFDDIRRNRPATGEYRCQQQGPGNQAGDRRFCSPQGTGLGSVSRIPTGSAGPPRVPAE